MVLEKLAHRAPMLPGDCGNIYTVDVSTLLHHKREGDSKKTGGSLSQKEQRWLSEGTHLGSPNSARVVQDRAAAGCVLLMSCD